MLGDFITSLLIVVVGYVYPAFECYKAVEKNRVEVEHLRFWCKYWIIMAALTVIDRFGDIFVSWLPMYGEMKLAFIIYCWSPKTMGTSHVYEAYLKPLIAMYELDIDQNMVEFRTLALDYALFFWHYSLENGQSVYHKFLEYLANRSSRKNQSKTQRGNTRQPERQKSDKQRRSSTYFMASPEPKTEVVKEHLPHVESKQDHQTDGPEFEMDGSLWGARSRLWRSQFTATTAPMRTTRNKD
ncbi:hypothetical protein ACHQM5_021013 [Ranunculus cassubicifolius]